MKKRKDEIFIVAPLLKRGRKNTITARELAAVLGVNPREVTARIEVERSAGAPILADCGSITGGYFLPESKADVDDYLTIVDHRIAEVQAHRDAVAAADLFMRFGE